MSVCIIILEFDIYRCITNSNINVSKQYLLCCVCIMILIVYNKCIANLMYNKL